MATKKKRAMSMAESPATSSPYVQMEDRKSGPFDQYEIRSALETLSKAEKIRKNGALMRAVRTEAKRQLASLTKTTASL